MRSFVQSVQMGEILGNSLQGKWDTCPTAFSAGKYCDARDPNQLPVGKHHRLLFQLLPTLLQRGHREMTDGECSSLPLHSSAVPQCLLAASPDLRHERCSEKSLLHSSCTGLGDSAWFCSWGTEPENILENILNWTQEHSCLSAQMDLNKAAAPKP